MKRSALIAASLGLTVNAHLFLSSPVPIEGSAPKSPLEPSGSNFPCHGVKLPTSGGQKMTVGSNQTLAFDTGDGANTAVHGGGSCQISITYETDPVKVKDPKNWKVIYSIEGGCPSNTYQNLDGNYQGPKGSYTGSYPCSDPRTNGVDCVNTFEFPIPKGVKDGHAIMAWTWFNNVGNREMYMNCVNAEFSGGDGSEMDSFPSMFVANLANVGSCPTTQSMNLLFPNPGKYVTTKTPTGEAAKTAKTFPMATATGAGCAGDGGAGAPSYGSMSAAPTQPAASSSNNAAPSVPAYSAPSQQASSDNIMVTVTTMSTVTGKPGPYPTGTAPSYGPNVGSGKGVNNSAPSSSCSNGAVSCSTPGDIVCIGSNQWGQCDIDNCAVPRALAAGTMCSNGSINALTGRRNIAGRRLF